MVTGAQNRSLNCVTVSLLCTIDDRLECVEPSSDVEGHQKKFFLK